MTRFNSTLLICLRDYAAKNQPDRYSKTPGKEVWCRDNELWTLIWVKLHFCPNKCDWLRYEWSDILTNHEEGGEHVVQQESLGSCNIWNMVVIHSRTWLFGWYSIPSSRLWKSWKTFQVSWNQGGTFYVNVHKYIYIFYSSFYGCIATLIFGQHAQ